MLGTFIHDKSVVITLKNYGKVYVCPFWKEMGHIGQK